MDSIESLIIGLSDPDASVRNQSAVALMRLGPNAAAAVPALMTVLSDEDLSNRGMAAVALGAIGPLAKDAVGSLIRLADTETFEFTRATAIESLSMIAPDDVRVRPAILRAIETPLVRKCAPRAVALLHRGRSW
jgi:HEAT repeat protein